VCKQVGRMPTKQMSAWHNTPTYDSRKEGEAKCETGTLCRPPTKRRGGRPIASAWASTGAWETVGHLVSFVFLMALSQMRTENDVQALRAIFCDNQGQLPTPVHQGIIYVMDAAGREHQLLVSHCKSREAFMRFLECDFKSGKKDRILRHFMGQGAYDLFIEDGTSTTQLDGWSRIRPGMRIIMSIVLENSLFGDDYKCPRCKIWNNHKEENDGWIDCVGCPGRFQITNANRKRNKTGTKFGQNPQGSMYPSASDYRPHLDVILNFHLRQHFFRPPLQGWIPRQIYDQESLSVQPVLGSHECSTHQEKSFLPKLTWGQLRTANIG